MKKFSILFLFLFGIFVFNSLKIEAYTSTSDDNLSTWSVNEEENKNVYGVEYVKQYGTTTSPLYSSSGNQVINMFSMHTDGVNSKLVSWAIPSGHGNYSRNGLSYIAEDYEKNHPGWIVVAGINADQYYATYGNKFTENGSFYYVPQPYYPLVMDGERRFAVTASGVSDRSFVGIRNDSAKDSLEDPSGLSGLFVEVIDENGKVLYKHLVNKINDTVNDNEVGVYFAYPGMNNSGVYISQEVSTSNSLYVVEDAEMAYMSNSRFYDIGGKQDSLFGRGVITKVCNEAKIDRWQFGIETNIDEVKQNLKEGTRVRVQFYYNNEVLNNCESTLGYHSVQRYNDEDINSNQPYDTNRYNRSVFGRKADGTYVLMTVSKGEYSGTSQNETNAILKSFGVVEAYQQDGGGSVTAIVRNDKGSFDVVQESSDSGTKQRAIFEGEFFVIRDPEYGCFGKDITRNSITLTKTGHINDDIIKNVRAEANYGTYLMSEDGNIYITGLNEDTEYDIKLLYDVCVDGKVIPYSINFTATTDKFEMPSSGIYISNTTARSITYDRRIQTGGVYDDITQPSFEILLKEVGVEYTGGPDYASFDSKIIKNLKPNTEYILEVHFSFVDRITMNNYRNIEEIKFKTKEKDVPLINSFNVTTNYYDKMTVSFDVTDIDNTIYDYFVSYKDASGKTYIYYPDSLSGEFVIEDDINYEESNEYSFKLLVAYQYEGKDVELESREITYTKEMIRLKEDKPTTPTKKKCGKKSMDLMLILTSSISLLYFIFKKHN